MHRNIEQAAAMDDKTSVRPFDPAAAGWQPYTDEGFIGLVGPFWAKPSGDEDVAPRFAFLAAPKHHNRRGVLQGGMLMTFADRSMGMTCWYANGKKPQATVHLDVHFVDAVANAALYLASNECDWVTGHVLNVDGGYRAAGISYDPAEIR